MLLQADGRSQNLSGDYRSQETIPVLEHPLQRVRTQVPGMRGRSRRCGLRHCGAHGRGRPRSSWHNRRLRRRRLRVLLIVQRLKRCENCIHRYVLGGGGGARGDDVLSAAEATLPEIEPLMSESAWMFFIL